MRTTVTLIVVLALGLLGLRAGLRLLDADDPATDARATAAEVADAWAAEVTGGGVDGLLPLAASRSDTDAMIDTHRAFHDAIVAANTDGTPATAVVTALREDGQLATATLAWTADLGAGASWEWTSELELIRGRGLWSVDWDPASLHPQLRSSWSIEVDQLDASRAPVLDAQGRALSQTGDVVEVGVQPGRLPDEDRLLPAVATHLPEAFDALSELLQRRDLQPDWYYPLVTIPTTRADEAWPDLLGLPGLIRRDGSAGVGDAAFTPEIVGRVVETEDGGREGASGLEALYDERLQGSAATEVWLIDPSGNRRELLHAGQDDAQPPLITTLDRDVQAALDEALRLTDESVGVVIMDPGTAGIVAVASRPSTGYDRALEGRYPPGAMAGVVPLTAAFLEGFAASDAIDCAGEAIVGGVRVTTRAPEAAPQRPTVADALGGGCDVALAQLGTRLGGEAMLAAVDTLGLQSDLELPMLTSGFAWPVTTSSAAEASAAVGHARVTSSAISGASIAASIARGAPAAPVLLLEDVDASPTPWPASLVAGLRTVLREAGADGTVQSSGVRVAGATARAGGVNGDPAPDTGWWFGFLEGAGPDLAFAVVVEGDDGTRAAAIAQRILDALTAS